MYKAGFVLFILLLVISGCGVQSSRDSGEQKSAYRSVKNSTSSKTQQDRHIEFMKNNPAVGTDINKAKEVVRSIPGYTPDSVWINGKDMWVTVRTDKNLSVHGKLKEASMLRKKLVQALPRYSMNVKIHER